MRLYSSSINEAFFRKICFDLVLGRLGSLQNGWTPETKLMDLGCGQRGSLGKFINSKTGCTVAFVDSDKESIAGLDAAWKVCASGLNLPFPDDSFDYVLCLDVIEHVPYSERELLIREISRVTKRGGRLFLSASKFSSSCRTVSLFFKPLFKICRTTLPDWFLEHDAEEPPEETRIITYLNGSGFRVAFKKRYQGPLNVFLMGLKYGTPLPITRFNSLIYVLLKILDFPPYCSFFMEADKS